MADMIITQDNVVVENEKKSEESEGLMMMYMEKLKKAQENSDKAEASSDSDGAEDEADKLPFK